MTQQHWKLRTYNFIQSGVCITYNESIHTMSCMISSHVNVAAINPLRHSEYSLMQCRHTLVVITPNTLIVTEHTHTHTDT